MFSLDHDACGVGFIAQLGAGDQRAVVERALTALERLSHRGGVDADGWSGDGAGLLVRLPREYFRREARRRQLELPERFALGMFFLPPALAEEAAHVIGQQLDAEGLRVLGWREVPLEPGVLGPRARATLPVIRQAWIAPPISGAFGRRLFLARKRIEAFAPAGTYACSLSERTLVYKGLLAPWQLALFYPDLADERFVSPLAVFHQRYSTNTSPSWRLAQPFRFLGHNGEINTIGGNRRWMRARQWRLRQRFSAGDWFQPLETGASDSASLDNALELLIEQGSSAAAALYRLIPPAWENDPALPGELRNYLQEEAAGQEPWDGPAAIIFSDGRLIGARLDRNGLRPLRYTLSADGVLVVGSETGIADFPDARVIERNRLGPGEMILADPIAGQLIRPYDVPRYLGLSGDCQTYVSWPVLAPAHPQPSPAPAPDTAPSGADAQNGAGAPQGSFGSLHAAHVHGASLNGASGNGSAVNGAAKAGDPAQVQNPAPALAAPATPAPALPPAPDAVAPLAPRAPLPLPEIAAAFGLSQDQCKLLLLPIFESGRESVFSMGDDAPPAFISSHRRLLWDYCKQRFAQVTNPPIDSLRETQVMSLALHFSRATCKLPSPLLDAGQRRELCRRLPAAVLDATFPAAGGVAAARERLAGLRLEAAAAVARRPGCVLLSDRATGAEHAPLPILLAASLVFQALSEADGFDLPLLVETGQAWDTHHIAMLAAVGASAVEPYLAWELAAHFPEGEHRFRLAIESGLRKVLAKMGISTAASYRNSQLFEIVGLDPEVAAEFFPAASAHLAGKSLAALLEEACERHALAFNRVRPAAANAAPSAVARPANEAGKDSAAAEVISPEPPVSAAQAEHGGAPAHAASNLAAWVAGLRDAGLYRYRHGGENHSSSPDLVRRFHAFVRAPGADTWRAYAAYVAGRDPVSVRHWLEGMPAPAASADPQLVADLLSRFSTQAMSLGAISPETHRVLAIAMNRLGARSNTGEGGEDPEIYRDQPEANNRIKQIASARFGVTAEYLLQADELEIKMAQGSKPGEGGQLPPAKVSAYIARLRHAVPGMALISPPPHHDIYSIEDLAQLIFDLKSINPSARIGVKLVSGAGVGIIAAGVAKAGAHVITISGFDGGTGASPLTSIKNTGLPWEIGLRDAHSMLLRSGFRSRVRLRVDGGLKSGRDIVLAALLGADEFGFGTAALIAVGCVMARQCHLNTCPVGIATQEEKLRKRFVGTPEMLIAFLRSVAEEAATLLAGMGASRLEDIVGCASRLRPRAGGELAAHALRDLLAHPELPAASLSGEAPAISPEPSSATSLESKLLARLDRGDAAEPPPLAISNRDRTIGAALTRHWLRAGAPGSATFRLQGVAGQSFGAFLAAGLYLHLRGEANDYVGKCLSGGELVVSAGETASRRGDVLVGNTCLYGATSGRLFVAGRAGERFAVRNSGAWAVVEGVGLHACEYMTAGLVAILGPCGANFGSGMTGGLAYIPRDQMPEFRWHAEYVRVADITAFEERQLRRLLEAHFLRTSSPRAARLLAAAGRLALVRVQPLRLPQAIEQTWQPAAGDAFLVAGDASAVSLAV